MKLIERLNMSLGFLLLSKHLWLLHGSLWLRSGLAKPSFSVSCLPPPGGKLRQVGVSQCLAAEKQRFQDSGLTRKERVY